MKIFEHFALFLLPLILFSSCDGDYRKEAQGQFGSAVVVMDSTEWDSETANAIRATYGGPIEYFQGYEERFNLTFTDFTSNEELENIKFNKNLIIAAPINSDSNVGQWIRAMLSDEVEQSVEAGESFAFPLQDKWYRNQWAMILTAPSDSALASKIRQSEQNLVSSLVDKELERWTNEVYRRGEKYGIEDSLMTNHGWKIRVQHDYYKHLDTTYVENGETNHLVTLVRQLPNNDRRFWGWWKEDVPNINFLDEEWINQRRDSLWQQWFQGSLDSSYVATDYREDHSVVRTRSFELNGDIAYETLGWWRMTRGAMGGPFASLTIYDDETKRLFMLGFWQFAPKYQKRRFVRQFQAMLRTFESDSTWNQNQTNLQASK